MSFLNVMLLGGAAAFLAPLVIHLLNRSRFQSVDWGAMHLLEAAMHVNSRRFQWENWLLLLLRCLIPILLAFCLARPVLTSLRIDGAGGKKSLTLLVDNSLSMEASRDDSTPLARAIEETELLVANNRSAEIGLWTMGGGPVNALGGTTFDPARVRRSLADIRSGSGASDIPGAIAKGIAQVKSMSNPSKQLVLLSDFQASQWSKLGDAELDALRGQLASGQVASGQVTSEQAAADQPEIGSTPIYLSLMRTSPAAASQIENLSISLDDYDSSTVLVGDSYRAIATVHNFGSQDVENARVVFSADDQELASRSVAIRAGATQDVAFACEFGSVGWHFVAAKVEETSGVAGDNIARRAIHVIEPTRLLIVDVDGGQDVKHSSGFLQLALAPFRSNSLQAADAMNAYEISMERGDQLTGENLRDFDVIVLANVPRLNDRSADAVAAFVERGGGLVIFAGPALDIAWYNSRWFDQKNILPMKLGERQTAAADEPMKLAKQVIQTPLLDIFNGAQAGELSTLEIQQWISLLTNEDSADGAAKTSVLLRLDSGAPLLAGRNTNTSPASNAEGKDAAEKDAAGRVLLFSTSCADDWSNLPLRPVYVPLMQRIVATASQRNLINANIRTGEALAIKVDTSNNAGANANVPQLGNATIFGPHELQVPWDVAAQNPLTFGRTASPGLYRVQSDKASSDTASILPSFAPELFTVSLDPSESDLRLLSDEELNRIAERLGATVVANSGEFVKIDKQRSDGQEIWRWLLVALLIFLFGEILLGQKITKGAVA